MIMDIIGFLIENYALLPVILPVLSAILVIIIGSIKENKEVLGTIVTIFMAATLFFAYNVFNDVITTGQPILVYYMNFPPPNAACFEIDGLSAVFALIFTTVALAVSIYSIGYMHKERITEYYSVFSFMVAGLNGVAYAGDLFTLLVFYELMGITAYILVAFYRNKEAIEAAIKYLLMGATGTALILYGIAMVYGLTGTLNLALIANVLRTAPLSNELYLILVLFLVGFGVKAALVPMHSWLPDAHPAAPSGISAMLSGVIIKGGVYAMLRTMFVLFYGKNVVAGFTWSINISVLFLVIAAITMTLPNLAALVQKDFKRMLAYSSIYNMGIIFAGIAVGNVIGFAAAVFHILNHALAKSLLFMDSGAYIMRIGTRNVVDLRGIGKKMPVTSITFVLGSLSLAGLPPLGGFYSKFMVIWAGMIAIAAGNWIGYWVAILIAVNATISLGYYFAILIRTIWLTPETSEKAENAKRAPITVIVGEFIVTAAMIAISIMPFIFFDAIIKAVQMFLDIDSYIAPVLSS